MTIMQERNRTLTKAMVVTAVAITLLFAAAQAFAEQAPNPFAVASTQKPPACTSCKDGAPGRDGKDGKDGRDGVDGRDGEDGKDGKDGAPGACTACPKPATIVVDHFDYRFLHPWTVRHEGDPEPVVAESAHGPLKRFVHYFRRTDTVVIVDFNLPDNQNVMAFRRLGETGVQWTSVASYAPGALVWFGGEGMANLDVKERTKQGIALDAVGYEHTCIVTDRALAVFFARMGNPVYYFALKDFVTNGVPPHIPTVSAAALERIVHEMAVQP